MTALLREPDATPNPGVPRVETPVTPRSGGAAKPLRIAIFAYEFPALSETFVLSHVVGLVELGHDVTIFAERPRADPAVHADIDRYGLRARIHYPALPSSRAARLAWGCLHVLRHIWRHPLVILRAINMFAYGRDALSLRPLAWASLLLDHAPFDVLHCHFGPVGRLVDMLREIGAVRGRLITTFHGVDLSAYLRDQRDPYRRLFQHGDLFMPISEFWRRRLIELGCDPGRIQVHHMGADVRGITYRPPAQPAGRALRVLTVGRLIEKKGVEYVLTAVAAVTRLGIAVRYAIVGDGPLRGHLEALARDLRLEHCVTFYGWQQNHTVLSFMADNDVLVAASVTGADGDQEGIPVTLMEAMATGLPVVATYHSGIPELVEDGVSGMLVPERNPEAIAAALQRLAREPELVRRLGLAARRRIERDYDTATLNRRLVQHYRSLTEHAALAAD